MTAEPIARMLDRMAELVGRSTESARLDEALRALLDGAGPVVELAGEAGIGKSRLLAELCARGRAAGVTVLATRAVAIERGDPYATLRHALGDTGWDGRAGEARHAAHARLRASLEAIAAEAPVLLAVDDAQWCDAATLEFLELLLARRWSAPLLLALAVRAVDEGPALRRAVLRARRDGDVLLELGPLDETAARALLGEDLDAIARDRILRVGGGNPFFLEELAREGAATHPATGALEGVPPGVAAALGDELAAVPAEARAVATGAAVAGESFDVELAAAAADVGAGAAAAAVDGLVAADLVRPAGPALFEFRHSLVWRAVLESAPPAWRAAAHRRVAAALAARGAPATAQAEHVAQSAVPGDEDAVALLARAGGEVSLAAPAIAARWYAAALRLRPPPDPRRLEHLVPLASACGAAGDMAGCRATLAEVLELMPEQAGPLRVHALTLLARTELALGEADRAEAMLEDGLAGAPAGSAEEAMLHLGLASLALQRAEYERMLQHADAARAAAEAAGVAIFAATATAKQALAAYHAARVELARRRCDEASAQLASLPRGELLQRVDSFAWLGWALQLTERHAEAERCFEQGLDLARATGHSSASVPLLLGRAAVALSLGRLADGLAAAEEGFDAATLTGQREAALWAAAILTEAQMLTGDAQRAVRTGETALAAAPDRPGAMQMLAGLQLGEARLAAGDGRGAAEEIARAAGGAALPRLERSWRARWLEVLCLAALDAGDVEAAAEHARLAGESARDLGLDGRAACAARAQAGVALATGDGAGAVAAAERSVELAERGQAPLERARSALVAARALAAAGRRDDALEHVYRAEAAFAAAGAVREHDEARAQLRALGRRGPYRRRGGSAPEGLTPREAQVAALVAQGRRNRDIAGELFVSESTVEAHLRSAFRKLGVSSRSALAARIAAEG